jgi:hypothetical protein
VVFCLWDETNETNERIEIVVDWAFILTGSNGTSEPERERVQSFLKKIGRHYGLRVAFAPVAQDSRADDQPHIRTPKASTRQRGSKRKQKASEQEASV